MSHTDLKPENMLFVNSDCNVTYNPRMVCIKKFALLQLLPSGLISSFHWHQRAIWLLNRL